MCGPTNITVVARDGTNDADMKVDFTPPHLSVEKDYDIKIQNGEFHFFGDVVARNLPLDATFVPGSMYHMQVGNRFHEIIFNIDGLYNFETQSYNVVENFDYPNSPDWKEGVLQTPVRHAGDSCFQVEGVPGATWWGNQSGYLDRFYSLGEPDCVSVIRNVPGLQLLEVDVPVKQRNWQYVHGCGAVKPFQVEGEFQGYLGPADEPTALIFTDQVVLLQ